jgi:hypothetical protein
MNTAKCSQMAEYAMHAVSRATSLSAAGGNSGRLTSWLRGHLRWLLCQAGLHW